VSESLRGFVATGSGQTTVELELAADRATLHFHSQWMGDAAPFELSLALHHTIVGSHSGALKIESARIADRAVPLPPSDGPILLEYARVPAQPAGPAGSDVMAVVGRGTDPWSLLLWLHADAAFDDGTQLPVEEYDPPPSELAPVVKVLRELERPWKLG